MSTPTPPVIPQPFANDAGPSFINVIPDTTVDTQRASYSQGFPSLTFQPEESGGKPPLGQDFNGILNAITQWLYALQGGALAAYSAPTATAIGGYNVGALVAMADGQGWWVNLVDDNATDPDAGGAGWQPVYAYGATTKAVTGGLVTLTAVEASRPYLIFSGTLSGNQQVVLPNAFRHWLVINLCVMGSFTLTVKTAAGVGLTIPAGGAASPTAVYGNTVDIYPVFVPAALPISVSPDPDTIVLRNNTGAAFGTTAPVGARDTQLATTSFANPAGDGTSWRQNPDGTIEQWGSLTKPANQQNRVVSFPVAFPNSVFGIQLTSTGGLSYLSSAWAQVLGPISLSQFSINADDFGTTTPNPTVTVYWHAIGR